MQARAGLDPPRDFAGQQPLDALDLAVGALDRIDQRRWRRGRGLCTLRATRARCRQPLDGDEHQRGLRRDARDHVEIAKGLGVIDHHDTALVDRVEQAL